MSTLSTALGVPYASGLSVDGVPVPLTIEGADAPFAERMAAIDGYATDYGALGVDVALVRAGATLAGTSPDVAESAFTATRAAGVASAAAPAAAAPSTAAPSTSVAETPSPGVS